MENRYRIRATTPADVESLAALETSSFSDPWTREMLEEALVARGAVALVALDGGRLAGSVMGREVAGEGEILSIAVAPWARRQGLGRLLLAAAIEQMGRAGAATVWLEVRASNLAALALYQQLGFVTAGTRRGYYRRPTEDAVVLRRDLAASPSAGASREGTADRPGD